MIKTRAMALMGVCLALGACGVASPDAGHQAVLISKPWFFGHGGVDPDPISTGRTYTWFSTDSVDINVMPQMLKEHFADLMSKDGVPLSFDAYEKLQIIDSVSLVGKFNGAADDVSDVNNNECQDNQGKQTYCEIPAWYASNLQGPVRNIIRDEVKQYGMNEVAITYTANHSIEQACKDKIQAYLTANSIPVKLIDFTLGKANPPDSVLDQRVQTAKEQQRQITEVQTTLAENARKNAEVARASADNAYREALGLSPEEFIQLQNINMLKDSCGSASKSSCTFVAPGTSVLVGASK